jgi:hypothetical protein
MAERAEFAGHVGCPVPTDAGIVQRDRARVLDGELGSAALHAAIERYLRRHPEHGGGRA